MSGIRWPVIEAPKATATAASAKCPYCGHTPTVILKGRSRRVKARKLEITTVIRPAAPQSV